MFIYSLTLLLNEIKLINELELLTVALVILIALSFHAIYNPTPKNQHIVKFSAENYLLTTWLGRTALHQAFWPFFLLLNAGLYLADTLVKTGYFSVAMWDDVHLIFFFPVVWWTIAIWRCAENTDLKIWAIFARFITFSVFFEYGIKFIIRIDYPRLFFVCDELFVDYSNCF